MIVALFVRSLEPKVLQIAVDNVIAYFRSGGSEGQFSDDIVSRLFYYILPDVHTNSLGRVLIGLGIIYLVISLLRGGFLLSASALTASSTEKAIKKLRDRLFAHIQKLPLKYLTTVSKGELIQRSIGDMGTVRRFMLSQVVEMIRMVAILVFAFFMMYIVNPSYALISIAVGPLLVVSSYLFFKKESTVWQEHEEEADRLSAIVQENLNGIRTVQAFANEAYEKEKFDRQNQRKLRVGLKHVLLHTLYWPSSDFLVGLQRTIAIVVGGYLVMVQQITVGELLGFYSYIIMVGWPMRQVGRVLSQMGMALVAVGRIYEILDAREEPREGRGLPRSLQGKIEFRNVSFRYDEAATEAVLENISFIIRPGEKVALIGPTGSGKSTIVNLLLGLYEPDEGEILIDGENIQTIAKPVLRQKIGVVLQTPFLFSTTVRENITYAAPAAEETRIRSAAEIAQIHELESVLPNGFDTLVGEKGVTLSGGQKQRVCLARTLLSQPDILVLDDVTSAVDTETEQAILNAVEQQMGDKTTLIISHRITSIQKAGRILVLSRGRIVQEGDHAELEKMDGYYRQIHAVQSVLEEEIHGIK